MTEDHGTETARPSGLRSPRFLLTTVLLLAVGLGVALWPIPWTVFSPSPPRPISEMVTIDGAPRDLSGELLASSAGYRKATPALAVWAWIDPSRDLKPFPDFDKQVAVTPADLALRESVMVAASVGLQLAGHQASVTSEGLLVIGVAPKDPAAALLQPGDVLLEANGEPLVMPSDLRALASGAAAGETVEMLRRRDGREELVDVPIHVTDDRERIEATTVPIRPVLTVPAGMAIAGNDVDADGGSAGLMLSLTVFDRFAESPLLDGRTITGTGSVDRHGGIHAIDGIAQKVHAAVGAGVPVFLAPASQYEDALAAATDAIEIIPVATVSEAIEALRDAV